MADIAISVSISEIASQLARRTSVATQTDPFYANHTTEKKQYSQLQKSDRITIDFIREAAKEVLKTFLSRQGEVVGEPFVFNEDPVIAQKQKETVSLFGSSGDARITGTGGLNIVFSVTVGTPLSDVAIAFVADNAAAYLAEGIVVTNSGDDIIFEAEVAGVPFVAPVVTTESGNFGGTVTHTTANVVASGGGNIIYRFPENASPLSINQTEAIVTRLTDNVKDAILYFALLSLYKTDGNDKKAIVAQQKCIELIDDLTGDLYRLHD